MKATTNPAKGKSTNAVNAERKWGPGRTKNGKSPTGSSDNEAIEKLLADKKWQEAQVLLLRELQLAPTDHWIWFTLSLTHYEQRDYLLAYECSKRAVELQPDCPLALWHYAGSLAMTHREEQALAIWNMLLSEDLNHVADGPCGEGLDWALRLINDVHYRMGKCYIHLEMHAPAKISLVKYLSNRKHGVASAYDSESVREYLETKHGLVVADD